jgi:hypothetical protein
MARRCGIQYPEDDPIADPVRPDHGGKGSGALGSEFLIDVSVI